MAIVGCVPKSNSTSPWLFPGTLNFFDLYLKHLFVGLFELSDCTILTAEGPFIVRWQISKEDSSHTFGGKWTVLHTCRLEYTNITCVAMVDDWTIVFACQDRSIKLYRWVDGLILNSIIGHSGGIKGLLVKSLAITTNSSSPTSSLKVFISGSADGTIKVWAAEDQRCIETIHAPLSLLSICNVDHVTFVTGTVNDSLLFYTHTVEANGEGFGSHQLVRRLDNPRDGGIHSIICMKDGTLVTLCKFSGLLNLWKREKVTSRNRSNEDIKYVMRKIIWWRPTKTYYWSDDTIDISSCLLLKLGNEETFAASQKSIVTIWNNKGELLRWLRTGSNVTHMHQLNDGSLICGLERGNVETWSLSGRYLGSCCICYCPSQS